MKAVVSSGHPAVTRAALQILEQGGNAFDAIIAAGFTSAVAEPALTSLGGGGFILASGPGLTPILYDFFPFTPGRGRIQAELEPHFFPVTVNFPGIDQIFNIGLGSVAVPGNLKGFIEVHQKLGKLPLSIVLEPAIQAAKEGVVFNFHQAYFLQLLKPIMTHSAAGRSIFSPNGQLIQNGQKLTNPDLADFISRLPEQGWHDFYEGDLARTIVQDMEHGQGLLTLEDLRSFEVVARTPLHISYRDRQMFTNPLPSFGGTLIAATLQLLGQFDFHDRTWGDSEHAMVLAHTLKSIETAWESEGTSLAGIDKHWFAEKSRHIRSFVRGTTQTSIADSMGNVASMTTSNGEGSGYIVPGTGIMLNNMMGEDDLHPNGFHATPPGEKIASMMSPTIICKKNEVEIVLGSGGSKRIRSAIAQVISNVVDFHDSITDAVQRPRMHWDGENLQMEPGFSETTIAALEEVLSINSWLEQNIYFGGVHAVVPGHDGAGDARRGGCADFIEL